jgi:prefoldin subunit 5
LKRKLLSPTELKEFRLQQEEQKRIRAAEFQRIRLEEKKKNRKIISPKELLDPKPVVEVIELQQPEILEPTVIKEPIEILQEKVEELEKSIVDQNYYDQEITRLESLISNKIELDDVNLKPLNIKIRKLKEHISQLPEVKYYDDDLEKLTERVDQLQVTGSKIFEQHGENLKEIKKVIHQILNDLDILSKLEIPEIFDPSDIHDDIVATKEIFYERIAEIKKEISELPEVKYYDKELSHLQEKIETVKNSIPEIPEIKSYDEDLDKLLGLIEEVRSTIPELPEVRYYETEISLLEECIKDVESRIPKIPEIKYYDEDISSLQTQINDVDSKIKFYDDDIKSLNDTIQNIENKIPEVKDYDEDIENISEDIDKVRDSLIDIKLTIRAIENSVRVVENIEVPEPFDPTGLELEIENVYNEIQKLKNQPVPIKENVDPLLPLDQKFVTFEDLSQHYRIFINRVQQQLASIGGGGEVNLRYLDDIDRTSIANGRVLSYDSTTKKFVFISPDAASSLWGETIDGNIYRNSYVGINTNDPKTDLDIVGNVSISGIITASSFSGEVVSNLDKTLQYYINTGSLSTVTTLKGSKTFYYDGNGVLTNIVGTGIYPSKVFNYDGQGNLINVDII